MAEVTEKSFPFDTDEVNGEYDRSYLAEDFARYFSAFITSGVFMKESTNLQVLENGDMTVTLKPGKLIIDGYRYDNVDDIIIQLEPADGVLNRIDRISGTWSKEDRDIHCTLQKGEPSYEPVPPECRRNADTKDYVFADVYVRAGAVSISQADITDQRLNTEVCGIANPFNEIDTTSIFNQFTEWLNITRKKGEADVAALIKDMGNYLELLELSGDNRLEEILDSFNGWFDRMKGQLSEDAAGHLQIEVDELRERLNEIGDPDFDDSGEIEGIASFTDFMEKFVKGTSIYQLFANFKAGLKYVLHAGQLVNNGLCEESGKFPLDAAYGKALTDQISQLYSDIGGFTPVIDETGKITGYTTTIGGADTVFPFSEIDKASLINALSASGLGLTQDSTAEQIYTALLRKFPKTVNVIMASWGKSVWNRPDASESYSASTSFTRENSIVISCKSNAGYANHWSAIRITGAEPYNLDAYEKLTIVGYGTLWGNGSYIGSTASVILKSKADSTETAAWSDTAQGYSDYKSVSISKVFDVSKYTGEYFIAIEVIANNRSSSGITLTELTLS